MPIITTHHGYAPLRPARARRIEILLERYPNFEIEPCELKGFTGSADCYSVSTKGMPNAEGYCTPSYITILSNDQQGLIRLEEIMRIYTQAYAHGLYDEWSSSREDETRAELDIKRKREARDAARDEEAARG